MQAPSRGVLGPLARRLHRAQLQRNQRNLFFGMAGTHRLAVAPYGWHAYDAVLITRNSVSVGVKVGSVGGHRAQSALRAFRFKLANEGQTHAVSSTWQD